MGLDGAPPGRPQQPTGLRTVIRALTAITAIGATLAVLFSQPTSAKQSCRPGDSRLAATQGHARVYWRLGELVYCRTKNAKRDHIVIDDSEAFPPPAVDLAGGFVGYAGSFPSNIGLAHKRVVRIRRVHGDIIYETNLNAAVPNAPGSLRITKAGGVAWIGCEEGGFTEQSLLECPPGSDRVVYKHDSTDPPDEPPELLARAKGIKVRSLRLRDDRLSWRKRDQLKTALLR